MKARRALTAAAITTGLVLTVAGCGSDDGGGGGKKNTGAESTAESKDDGQDDKATASKQPESKVLAEVTGDDSVTLTINSAVREEGGFLTLSGQVRNGGSGRWVEPSWRGDEKELAGNGQSMAGATIVDQTGNRRYYILRDTDGRCLCTQFKGGVKGGETATWYAQFPAPPASASKVTFQIADMPPAPINLSEGE